MSATADVEVQAAPRARRVGVWVAIGVFVLVLGGVGAALATLGAWNQRASLDPESAGAFGTRAVAQLLRDGGVEVVVARDRAAALRELAGGDATLVLPDAPALSDDAVRDLGATAMDVVLLDPFSRELRLFLPGSTPAAGGSTDPVDPACDLPEAERSGPIAPNRVFAPSGGAVTACYPSGDGYGLLVQSDGDHRVAAIDGRSLFVNESLAEDGNAALALNLMGRHPVVVWYMPSLSDTDLENTTPSLGELTPDWVSPVMVLLLVTGVAAAVWRGRRFGPLVAERLPVTVRASETTEGRGRLYARARDSVHAADQLRIGGLTRISRLLSLGPGATAIEIADAAAIRTGADRATVRGILIDSLPADDRDLLTLRADLRDLEAAVRAAV